MNEFINISVIVPIYGVERFIERCARSLFEQTMKEGIEFIFVNDCTTDNSISILKSVLEEYPRRKSQVTILEHEHNKGLPQARKTGFLVAKGEYIAHCDSDDWVDKKIYQTMYETAISENADIVCCDFYKSDGTTSTIRTIEPTKNLLLGPVWNKICRKRVYCNNIIFPVANKAEDGALMAQLSYFSNRVYFLNEPLYYYFQNPDSMCRIMSEDAMLKRLKEHKENIDLIVTFLNRENAIETHKLDILYLKRGCRDILLPYIHKKKYRKLWRNTYPEINMYFIFNRNVGIQTRINFIMDYLGCHAIRKIVNNFFHK